MAKGKPKSSDSRQYPLDFETTQRERWAAIRMLKLPKKNSSILIRFLIDCIEGIGQGRPLTWSLKELGERMSAPDSTLRDVISAAEEKGLIVVEKTERPDGKFNILSLANNIQAMRQFSAKSASAARDKKDAGNIASLLRKAQLWTWKTLSEDLEARGIAIEHVQGIIAHWMANKHRWIKPCGVLYFRLLNASPDIKPDENWPPASVPVKDEATAKQLGEMSQHKAHVSDERRRVEELEEVFGKQLDALPRDKIEAMAQECLDLEHAIWSRMWKKYRDNPERGMVREKLLEYLAGSEVKHEASFQANRS